MRRIEESIKSCSEYFIAMNITIDHITVMLDFPETWQIENFMENKDGVNVIKKNDNYYVVGLFENGFDVIFDVIDMIIKINKEMEEKTKLLKEKAQELTELFLNSSLEELQNLEFQLNKPKEEKKNNKKIKQNKEVNTKIEAEEPVTVEEGSLLSKLASMNGEELTEYIDKEISK